MSFCPQLATGYREFMQKKRQRAAPERGRAGRRFACAAVSDRVGRQCAEAAAAVGRTAPDPVERGNPLSGCGVVHCASVAGDADLPWVRPARPGIEGVPARSVVDRCGVCDLRPHRYSAIRHADHAQPQRTAARKRFTSGCSTAPASVSWPRWRARPRFGLRLGWDAPCRRIAPRRARSCWPSCRSRNCVSCCRTSSCSALPLTPSAAAPSWRLELSAYPRAGLRRQS